MPAATLPGFERGGATLRVIAGRAYGEESPVRVFADTLNVAIDLAPDAETTIDATHAERALYILDGEAQLDGADIPIEERDGDEFLALAPRVPVATQITRFPLAEANRALEALRKGELQGAAVLVMN